VSCRFDDACVYEDKTSGKLKWNLLRKPSLSKLAPWLRAEFVGVSRFNRKEMDVTLKVGALLMDTNDYYRLVIRSML